MGVRLKVEFDGDSMEEIVGEVQAWLEAQGHAAEGSAPGRERALREVLASVRGAESRRLLLDLARAALDGAGVRVDDALRERYGKAPGATFAGTVGGPNKLMRRIAGRDLIRWDPVMGGYRIERPDAEVIVEFLPTPGEASA